MSALKKILLCFALLLGALQAHATQFLTDPNGEFILRSGQRMTAGQTAVAYGYVQGTNIRTVVASLAMQGDGNLVLYKLDPGNPAGMVIRWSSGTHGNPGAYLSMQTDGNLVVYRADGYPLWATNTDGYGPTAHMRLQSDGNMVVYSRDALWASNSWRYGMPDSGQSPPVITSMVQGDVVTSRNQQFQLVLQGDGNLVIYQNGGGATWATGKRGNRAVVQGDGNFVLYSGSQWQWASGTHGYGPNVDLVLQDDGNLVLYGNKARWNPDKERPWYDVFCSLIKCEYKYETTF